MGAGPRPELFPPDALQKLVGTSWEVPPDHGEMETAAARNTPKAAIGSMALSTPQ